jgi:uncharacterized protein YjiS (DUF1127 family)
MHRRRNEPAGCAAANTAIASNPGKETVVTTLAPSLRSPNAIMASNPITFAAVIFARRVGRWLKIREDRRALQAMPDYLLSDIGISRGEIEAATQYGRHYPLGPSYRL